MRKTPFLPVLTALLSLVVSGCAVTPRRFQRTRHAYVRCEARGPEAALVTAEVDPTVESIARFLEIPPPLNPITLYVFPDQAAMADFLARYCPERKKSHATCFETPDGMVATLYLTGDRAHTLGLLRHEMTHYVLASHFYDMPVWVDEGLAWFFQAGEPYGRVYPVAVKRLRRFLRGKPESLERLVAIPMGWRIGLDDYARSWSIVYYLYRTRGGLGPIMEYLRRVHSGPEAATTFKAVFGETPERMEPEWRRFTRELVGLDASPESRHAVVATERGDAVVIQSEKKE